jgi:hypothetical protein
MSPLVVGPILALVGIVAAYFVLRGKAKTRKSMYRTLREQRERDLRKARDRATAAEAATQAAAAAPAAAQVEPASTASIPTQEPATEYTPPAPAYVPQAPAYTPPEPAPVPIERAPVESPPVESAPVEILPEPPPAAGSKPAWEIVQPDKPEADAVHAAGPSGAGAGKASWELDPREQQRINERHKGTSRFGEEEEEDDAGAESLPQVLLSYAGLVAALLVILLGILFMIGARA